MSGSACARALAAAGAIMAAGCVGGSGEETPTESPETLAGTAWAVETIDGARVPTGARTSVSFPAPGRIAGNSGCNRYTGTVELGRGTIRTGPLAGTRMACPPPMMQQEVQFLVVLEVAERWRRVAGGGLELLDAEGVTRLTLSPARSPAQAPAEAPAEERAPTRPTAPVPAPRETAPAPASRGS